MLVLQLKTWFPASAEIWMPGDHQVSGVHSYGGKAEIMTREVVFRESLNRLAHAMHERYRQESGLKIPAWHELSPFLRESNIAAADHLTVKARLVAGNSPAARLTRADWQKALEAFRNADAGLREKCLRNEHARWMRFHSLYNWQFGEQRDNHARIHPSMRPWEELTEAEKERDAYAWQLLAMEAEETE